MPIKLTAEAVRSIFPRAPRAVVDAFVAKQDVLTKAGINATRTRLAYFFANIEHECGGFTIPNLTENINYTAARMAAVWPKRFKTAAAVTAKYGSGAGWQKKAIDDIYGSRMGNRPGTSDGSTYIGRGGPQWTGRDGYAALERLTGLPSVSSPTVASQLEMQPEICAAFWTWKGLNRFADANDFLGCVKVWNGGTNGLADRQALMAGNDPILKKLETVASISAAVPDAKAAPVSKEDAGKAIVVGTVAAGATAGAHQGWTMTQWGLLAGGVVLLGAAIYLGLRWWKAHKAAPSSFHDMAIPGATATADKLPAPAAVWSAPEVQATKPAARRARKQAAKKPGRKAAKVPTPRRKSPRKPAAKRAAKKTTARRHTSAA